MLNLKFNAILKGLSERLHAKRTLKNKNHWIRRLNVKY